jgi:hypothetical protein
VNAVRAWIDYVTTVEAAAVSAGLREQSIMEMFDVAWEDAEGRLPIDEGYEGRWAREAEQAKHLRRLLLISVPNATTEEADEAVMAAFRRLAVAA